MERSFVMTLTAAGALALDASAGERPAWFESALVGIETGPTGAPSGGGPDPRYVSRFDGRECIRLAAAAHCDYAVIWARDGAYTYYDSALQPKAPGLGDRDVLREAVDEASRHGMPLIAYCVLQYPTHTLREHPGWRMRDSDGRPIDRVCFNSPYLGYVKALLREMMGYRLAGFHLDMVDQGFGPPYGCWCEHCAEKFEGRYGRPLPETIGWDADWERMLEFRYDSSAGFEEELDRFVKGNWPGVSVDFNYHGSPPFSFEVGQRPVQHGTTGDFITGETGLWAFSPLGVGLSTAFYRAVDPGRRVQVVMQRGVRHYHDQTTRPLMDMRWEMLTALAHGGFVTMVDKLAYDGWLDPVFYERLAAAYREAHDKAEHFGQAPHADVGIYFSHRTRDWIGRGDAARSWQGFMGAHKALVYGHVPWGVVLDENATLGRLEQFPVIVLPNVGILLAEEVENLTRYVERGGRLVVTGATGLFDRYGRPLDRTVLEPLLGARFVRALGSEDNHVRFSAADTAGPLAAGLRPDWPFLVHGRGVVYEPAGARASGQLLEPHRTPRQRSGEEGVTLPMSADEAVGPAVLVNEFGRGKVVTFAVSPGEAAAGEFHIAEARQLLPRAVEHVLPEPAIEIDAPTFVESVVTREGDTLRVHLLGRVAPATATPPKNRPFALPSLVEDAPLYRVQLRCRRAIADVRSAGDTTRLERRDANTVRATIDDVHEVIVVKLR